MALLASFLLFCLYLKWQPYLSRMFLPLFVCGAAIVGAQLERLRPRWLPWIVCLFLLNNARPYLARDWTRPLQGHGSYFADTTQVGNIEPDYRAAADLLKQGSCREIGVDTNEFQIEYPLLVLLPGFRFTHTGVRNPSAKYSSGQPEPCAVVCLNCAGKPMKTAEYEAIGPPVQRGSVVVIAASRP